MNFLILSRLPGIYSTRRLVEEIQTRGHRVLVEHPETFCPQESFDVLIPRLGQFRYEEALAHLRHLEKSQTAKHILNAPEAFHQARHKKLAGGILAAFPQPQTYPEPTCFPLVVKDCLSSQGEGVFLCRTPQELQSCLYKLQGRDLLFQEFISESQGRDIRAFVIGSRVSAAMERMSQDPEREFRSNLSLGGTARPTSLTPAEEALCLKAVQRLQLDYAGVDFIRSRRGPLLLEVNPCPGLEGIEKYTQGNIARDLILYAETL